MGLHRLATIKDRCGPLLFRESEKLGKTRHTGIIFSLRIIADNCHPFFGLEK
ncbi:hypothetical protein DBB_33510 [Desulfoluna spongiiphila]|nr:hypothetical protein DBB_33510 [Desulfoluna spongiiphila]